MTTPIEETIANLLRKAEGTDNIHEAELFSAAAEKMMIKHGIERAMLDTNTDKKEEIVILKHLFTGIYSWEMFRGSYAIAKSLDLGSYYSDNRAKYWPKETRGIMMSIVGFKSDAEEALRLVQSLSLQNMVAMKKWNKNRHTNPWDTGMDGYKARREFIEYFGVGAASRIKENRKTIIEESSTGTALVLVDRKALIDDKMVSLGLIKKSDRRSFSGSGIAAGTSAGRNASTGERSLTGGRGISA